MQGIPSDMEYLPEYVYIETSEFNKTLILSTKRQIVGMVWMFRTQEEMDEFIKKCRTEFEMVDGYRILVTYYRQLGLHNYRLLYGVLLPEVLPEMADFYLKDRVIPHAPRYKKYKIAD